MSEIDEGLVVDKIFRNMKKIDGINITALWVWLFILKMQ